MGAAKLLAKFSAAGEQAQLSLYFTPHASWDCRTKVRAKVKLVSVAGLGYVNGLAMSINSGTSSYSAQFTSTTGWSMDTWYTVELPFATASYQNPAATLPVFTDVASIGIMVQIKSAAGTVPVETTLYVDDVWLE